MYNEINSPYVLASSDPLLGRPDASPSNPISPEQLPPCHDIDAKPLGGLGIFTNTSPFGIPFFSADPFHPRSFSDSGAYDDLTPPLSMSDISSSPAALFLSSFSPNIDVPAVLPDDEGQSVAGYVLGPIVGRGGFSTIRTGTSPSGDIVAVKIVRRSDVSSQLNPQAEAKRLDHEAHVWSSLHHEHILPLFKSEHTSYADFFITQYCPEGSLFDILKRDGRPALPHDDVGTMFRQVVRGLQYMHDAMAYVHGDIKLENILVDEMGVCKIADFGMTRKIGEVDPIEYDQHDREHSAPSRRHTKGGLTAHASLRHKATDLSRHALRHRNSTPARGSPAPQPAPVYQQGSLPYASPELLLPNGGSPYLPHPAQDIWALGVMLYCLLTGRLPFADSLEPRLQMKILHGVFEMPADIGLPSERVLSGCLDTNVASRWTISMVDEVAWGIGWASQDSSPASDDEPDCDPVPAHNRTRTISTVISDSDSDSNSPPHTHSIIPGESLLSGPRSRGSPSSSRSRSPTGLPHALHYIPPSFSTLNDSILGTDTARPSPHSSTPNLHSRGRPRTKAPSEGTDSRSISPGMAPLTPPDFVHEFGSRSRRPQAHGADYPHDLGRTRGTSRFRWRGSELDNIHELSARERWGASRPRNSSRSRLRDDDGPNTIGRRIFDPLNKGEEFQRGRSSRAGSQPPRSSSSASREKKLREIERDWLSWRTPFIPGDAMRGEIVGRMNARSRSVGFDFGDKKARSRSLAPL